MLLAAPEGNRNAGFVGTDGESESAAPDEFLGGLTSEPLRQWGSSGGFSGNCCTFRPLPLSMFTTTSIFPLFHCSDLL